MGTVNVRKTLMISTGVLAILLGTAYYYVFIAGAPQFDPPAQETDTGLSFQLESFDSQAMGMVRQYGVILPPGYRTHPQKRYPVIVLLHGGHDDARAYVDKYAITTVLHQLYQSKKLPPSIIITPDGNDKRGSSPIWDPQYYDGPNGNVGTLIGEELVNQVKSRYRTLGTANAWAIGGLSSGGWGAVNIGLHHPGTFHILFSHSGYFTDSSGTENSPQAFIKTLTPEQRRALRIYLDAGKNDSDFVASTQQFHETLTNLGVANEFHVFPGGHGLSGADIGWNYFHKHLLDSLSYVGEQFKQAGV